MYLITYVMIVCCSNDSVDREGATYNIILSDGASGLKKFSGTEKFDSIRQASRSSI